MSTFVTNPPTLFVVEGGGDRTLEDVMLGALAQPELAPCPICDGQLDPVVGGARCRACGSEILTGEEPSEAWAA